MASRRHNPKRAKSLHSFTIAEAADLYSVHRNTVRHWLVEGLDPIDARKPVLIHGSELNRFHAARRQSVKQTCGPFELFCLGCRAPRRPASDIADFTALTASVGALQAICPVCDRIMTQRVNAARLERLGLEIEVTVRLAREPIKE